MEVTNQQILDELKKRPGQVSNILAAIAFGAVLFMAFWANGLNDNIPAEMRENRQEAQAEIDAIRAEMHREVESVRKFYDLNNAYINNLALIMTRAGLEVPPRPGTDSLQKENEK